MKKTLLRTLATCLTLIMLLGLTTVFTFAADASGTCGANLKWELNGSKLTITGSGAMNDFTAENEAPWFEYRYAIKDVSIASGVTTVGSYAFAELENLTSVDCGGAKGIGNYAFYACPGLAAAKFNSATNIGDYAFAGCADLLSAPIPSGIVTIGEGAFMDTGIFAELSFGTSLVEIGDMAFMNCDNVSGVKLGDSVKTIGDFAFSDCEFVSSVVIGKSVTSIGVGAFAYCSELNQFYINSANSVYAVTGGVLTSKDGKILVAYPMDRGDSVTLSNTVKEIGDYAFAGSFALGRVTFPNALEKIGESAFADCWALSDISIPNTVTSVGPFAFASCFGVTSVSIPKSVTTIGEGAFAGLPELKSFTVNGDNGSYSVSDGILYNKEKTVLLACPGGKTGDVTIADTVRTIEPFAFYGCGLSSVTMPATLRTIGDNAFDSCPGLTAVTIPRSVSAIGESVFVNCPGITGFSVVSGNTSYMAREGVLFTYGLKELVCYPAGKTSPAYTVPIGVTAIKADAFAYCTLQSVSIPDSVTVIESGAFSPCDNLKSVALGGVREIGDYAFADNLALEEVTIPESVRRIGEGAFAWCKELKAVTVCGTPYIAEGAFAWCEQLRQAMFRSNAPTDIGALAFYGSDGFKIIYLAGTSGWTTPTWMGYNVSAVMPASGVKGDVTGDGILSNADLILVARHLVSISFVDTKVADMDEDGRISNADLIVIARMLVNM